MPTNWQIGNTILPIPPLLTDERVLRKQTVDSLIDQFPGIVDSGPQGFELQVKGLIWPKSAKEALIDEIRNAEEPSTQIQVADSDASLFGQYEGRYAVSKSSIKIDGPNFTRDDDGNEVPVWTYDIVFIQFTNQTNLADVDQGTFDGDESGVGFAGLEDILGDFDFDQFIFTIGNLFTI